jgi:FKBP-type peptidyl-prolyl cis-trans isomerase
VTTPTLPVSLLGLLACSSLLLLGGCGTDDSGTSGTALHTASTDTGQGAGSATSTGATAGKRTCANVPSRNDDFRQPVTFTSTTADGLKYGDIIPGSGATAVAGSTVTVQYSGWLADGTKFDSSRQAGRDPFEVTNLGNGQVIKGWNEGLQGMKLGGVRRLVIPPALAYGPSGSPPVIPPNATLTFDVQLLCVTLT